jgi:hypothetical protein
MFAIDPGVTACEPAAIASATFVLTTMTGALGTDGTPDPRAEFNHNFTARIEVRSNGEDICDLKKAGQLKEKDENAAPLDVQRIQIVR